MTSRPTVWDRGVEKLLVKKILENPSLYKWQVQGLGMLRTYLRDDWRLHIWDNSVRVDNVSPLHDHPWNLHSTIVAGTLYNTRYVPVEPAREAFYVTDSYKGATIRCGEGACVLTDVKDYHMWRQPKESYYEGESYTQTKDEIHKTDAENGTVTLVYRTFYPERETARVYWKDGDFVSAEPRRATPEEIERITKTALDRWFI